jgi:uncharacterized protein YceK
VKHVLITLLALSWGGLLLGGCGGSVASQNIPTPGSGANQETVERLFRNTTDSPIRLLVLNNGRMVFDYSLSGQDEVLAELYNYGDQTFAYQGLLQDFSGKTISSTSGKFQGSGVTEFYRNIFRSEQVGDAAAEIGSRNTSADLSKPPG